ncbi:MAG: hypothetical protein AB1440_06830 [Pseudomonadota bacterium]|jgi:hypothetical protein
MPDDKENPTFEDLVKRLVEETGITEAQALELVLLIGLNWSSLVREAKALKSGA